MTWPKDTTPADTTVSYTTTLSVCFFHRYYLSVYENSLSCRLVFQMQLCSKYKDAGNVMQVVGINRQSCRLRNRPIKKGGGSASQAFFFLSPSWRQEGSSSPPLVTGGVGVSTH